jgi:hypothetical protein
MSRPAWGHVTRYCIHCGGVGPRTQVVGGWAHKRCLSTETKGPSKGPPAKKEPAEKLPPMSAYKDAKVKLLKELRTQGGDVFKAGLILRVTSWHRGTLALSHAKLGNIRCVARRDVELLEK